MKSLIRAAGHSAEVVVQQSCYCMVVALAIVSLTGPASALVKKPAVPSQDPEVAYRYPVATAPLLSSAPVIDGRVNKEEWEAAAQSAPLVALTSGVGADEPGNFWIGYTADALHLAFHFERPPSSLVPLSGKVPLDVWRDDAFELFLRPQLGATWDYNFVGNAAGVHEEGRRQGNTDKSWNATWKYAARLTPTGWEGEMSIPFASLGVKTPEIGTAWEMNFMSNRKTPRGEIAAWSYMKTWYSLEDFGYLVFGGQVPAVRVLQAGELSRGDVGVMLELSNFEGQSAALEVDASLLQPRQEGTEYFHTVEVAANPLGAQAEVKEQIPPHEVVTTALRQYESLKGERQSVVVPARQSKRVLMSFPSTRGAYVLHYAVRDPKTGNLLGAAAYPFYRRAPIEIDTTPFLLSAGTVQATVDYRKVAGLQPGNSLTVSWSKQEPKSKADFVTSAPVNLNSLQTSFDIPVQAAKPGRYALTASITNGAGQNLGERRQEVVLPAKPDWAGNSIGIPEAKDRVPEPWTAIRREAAGFSVWNRKVTLGPALQPSQVLGGQSPMLARAMSLDVKATGLEWSVPKVVKEKKTGLTYSQTLRGENFTAELTLEAEFDGFMKYTLRMEPRAGATDASLDWLVLDIPLKPEMAEFYRHGFLGTPGSQSEVEGTYRCGALKDSLNLPFTDTVWLGNDSMGLEWSAESDQWWQPDSAKEAVQIVREPGATVLRINLVNKTRTISGPMQYQWAVLPTPAKPMNEQLLHGLRLAQSGFSLNEDKTALRPRTGEWVDALREADVNAYHQYGWGPDNTGSLWNPEGWSMPNYRLTSPLDMVRQQAFREANEIAYKHGLKWSIAYAIFSSVYPNWPGVGDLWKEQVSFPISPSLYGTYMFCPARPFADFYISQLDNMIRETKINGVYLDSSADVRLCTNLHHGHGYVDEQGKLHGTYPVWELRELHKRIYMLFHGEATEGGLVYAHNSHFPFMATESFVDVHHCGEGSDFVRDQFVPKYYGRPFGLPVTFTRWNNPLYPDKRMNSWRVALLLDATIKVHPAYVVSREANKIYPDAVDSLGREVVVKGYDEESLPAYKIWQAQKDFPYEQALWIPPWKVAPYVQTGDPDLLAAVHVAPGRAALVVVSSFKKEATKAGIKLDWKKLGFNPAKVRLVDCITDEVLSPSADGVSLEVLDNRWRLFSIKPVP